MAVAAELERVVGTSTATKRYSLDGKGHNDPHGLCATLA